MAFTEARFRGAMLIMLNGEDPKTAPLVLCEKCGKPMMRVFVTARVRQLDGGLAEPGKTYRDVCINKAKSWLGPIPIPCPKALDAAGLIDRLMEASRR